MSVAQRIWHGVATLAAPLLPFYFRLRVKRGKEIAGRLGERRGEGAERPPGPLFWIHAASVGETLSILPLLPRLLEARAALHILVTTGTVNAARLLAQRLPPEIAERVQHRFVPLDVPAWVARFLDDWRPDAAAFVESEFWPNLLAAATARNIPLALLNARISPRSARRWARMSGLARETLQRFTMILAQSEDDAARLVALGATGVTAPGNLKFAALPLPADAHALAAMREATAGRPILLAASTHLGEEAMIAEAHALLRERFPELLTILVPRHPERGAAIAASLALPTRRSVGAMPANGDALPTSARAGDGVASATQLEGDAVSDQLIVGAAPAQPSAHPFSDGALPPQDNFRAVPTQLEGDAVSHQLNVGATPEQPSARPFSDKALPPQDNFRAVPAQREGDAVSDQLNVGATPMQPSARPFSDGALPPQDEFGAVPTQLEGKAISDQPIIGAQPSARRSSEQLNNGGIATQPKIGTTPTQIAERVPPLTHALPTREDGIYLADTLGELGLFYRLADVAVIGGSLVPRGGQNPLEPARLGCPIIAGPHMDNFAVITELLGEAQAIHRSAPDPAALAEAVAVMLSNPEKRRAMADAAARVAAQQAELPDRVAAALLPMLDGSGANEDE